MKVLKLVFILVIIFIISASNAKEITFQNIKISFSDKQGTTDSTVKIIYAKGKTAYLLPLDANKKKFTKLKYSKISKNTFKAMYYSKSNGMVSYCYTLDKKTGYIKVETSSYNCYLQLKLKADAIVIPDQVTNDELFWADKGLKDLRIPSDNHLFVELLDNGNAMLNCLWNDPDQEIIAGFNKTTFTCTPGNNIWFGFLAKNNIWYKPDMELTKKYISNNWTPPFDAVWHMLFRINKGHVAIADGTGDMWVLYNKGTKNKIYLGISLDKTKEMQGWGAGMGWIRYPCFVDTNKTYLSLPQFKDSSKMERLSYSNITPVIYPFSSKKSPNNMLLPSNAVAKFLGKAPMEKLHMRKNIGYGFPATCGVTQKIEKIFYRGDAEVNKKKDHIRKQLKAMDMFVHIVNTQIKDNIRFVKSLQRWLKDKKKHYPKLKKQIDKYIKELEQVNRYYILKKEKIKTPAYYMTLSKKISNIIDSKLDEEEKETQIKSLGRKIRSIGGAQDTTSGVQRLYLKAIKQQVTLALIKAKEQEQIEFLKQFRKKLHQKLKIRGMMEGK